MFGHCTTNPFSHLCISNCEHEWNNVICHAQMKTNNNFFWQTYHRLKKNEQSSANVGHKQKGEQAAHRSHSLEWKLQRRTDVSRLPLDETRCQLTHKPDSPSQVTEERVFGSRRQGPGTAPLTVQRNTDFLWGVPRKTRVTNIFSCIRVF